jgi:hypothetical protein
MARNHPDAGKSLGYAECSLCAHEVKVKISVRGLPYYNCDTADGGCGHQSMTRTADAALGMYRQVKKWNDPAERRARLGDEALPAKARKPEVEPEPEPKLDAEPQTDPAPVDIPPPPPREKPSRTRAKPSTPAPVAKPVRLFGRWR